MYFFMHVLAINTFFVKKISGKRRRLHREGGGRHTPGRYGTDNYTMR